MNFRKTLLVATFTLACGLFSGAQAQNAADLARFTNTVNGDFQSITNYVNAPFASALGFFTSLGWDSTPTVFDLTSPSGPHFNLSLGAGADFIPLPNLSNLTSLSIVSATSNLSLPSGIPLPYPVITARIGLFNGFDAGFRYTYLPPISAAGVGGNFNGWGIDLRYKIFDGIQLPTVTLSTSFDTMSGSFSVNTANINQSVNYTDPVSSNNYPNASITGSSNYALNWNTQSVGAKIMVGKNLGIFYPFAGIGFQRNSGTITSTISGLTATLDASDTNSVPSAVSSSAPVVLEPKYVLGFNLGAGLGFEWAVVGESNGTDIAGNTSFGLQF